MMRKISNKEFLQAIESYKKGRFPWKELSVDWFILVNNKYMYPIKYIYALAINQIPSSFTTNQAKSGMRHLSYQYISLKALKQDEMQFEESVNPSLNNRDERLKRLKKANKIPKASVMLVLSYARNPDVVDEVLERASGKCESCKNEAPFVRRSNKTPYLEVHHVQMLSEGGSDTVDNAIAVCPNCHRQAHYG